MTTETLPDNLVGREEDAAIWEAARALMEDTDVLFPVGTYLAGMPAVWQAEGLYQVLLRDALETPYGVYFRALKARAQELSANTAAAAGADPGAGQTPVSGTVVPGTGSTDGAEQTTDITFVEGVQPICQFPELPTGCEVTALAIDLAYYGIEVDKEVLADDFLEKGEMWESDFRKVFLGDPRDPDSYGCYAPVLVKCANAYLQSIGSDLHALDLTGTELLDLFDYIDAGVPVIIWGTYDNEEPHAGATWYVGEELMEWISPEHCMVLAGYGAGMVCLANPTYGTFTYYPMQSFLKHYNALYRQAVVIQ